MSDEARPFDGPKAVLEERSGLKALPQEAPQVAAVLFRFGCLTSRQAAALWPTGYTNDGVRKILRRLVAREHVERERCCVLYSPGNDHQLGLPPASRSPRWAWEDVFSLTPSGVRYVADIRELPLKRAQSMYRRSYSEGRRNHAYLRNEAYTLIAEGLAGSPDEHLLRAEAEGGVGRARIVTQPGEPLRFVEPDGLLEILQRHDGRRRKSTVFVESDTGSQDSVNVIAQKVESYARWYVAGGTETELDVRTHPPVLFVSPTVKTLGHRVILRRRGRPALPRKLPERAPQEADCAG